MLIQDAIEKIASKAPGCPEPELIDAYRYAAIDFCKRTRVMTAWITTTTAAMAVATISPDQQITDILDALFDGEEVSIVGINDRAVTTATDQAPVLTWRNPNLPQIVPQPALSREVQMLMVFAPGPASTTVDDSVWLRYSEELNHGALARLFAVPGVPYSNQALATYHQGMFDRAVSDAASTHGSALTREANKLRTKPSTI